MARATGRPVREEVLAEATRLIQQVGVDGFSYADLAEAVGVKPPSIHHHFRRKEDLVAAVTGEYRMAFAARVDAIAPGTATERLHAYAEMFAGTAADDLMCLCGAVAAEWLQVGTESRREVDGFFDDQLRWLSAEIGAGISSGDFDADVDQDLAAQTMLAALEGAVLMSRSGKPASLASSIGQLLVSRLSSSPAAR